MVGEEREATGRKEKVLCGKGMKLQKKLKKESRVVISKVDDTLADR
jgi:hypothetical protein